MVEDIKLDTFPKEAGVYLFKVNEEVIYVGSSNNLYKRMTFHRSCIRKGSADGNKQDLYQFLQSNPFTVEFQTTDSYRQLEQELVEKYHPKYNIRRANTGVARKGNKAEYNREYKEKYKDEIKQYYDSHKEEIKQYRNQLCFYRGETLTLCALSTRFGRMGIDHPVLEAKKYLIKDYSISPSLR